MSKKRIMCGILLLIVLSTSLLTFTAYGAEIRPPTAKEDVYIYDQDNCINDDVEQKLNNLLVELEKKTGAEFVVISITSLNNLSIEEYANDLFNTLGIGKKGKDNGALLLFSRSDKRVRLEIGRSLEGCLNDAKCGRILDDYFVPYREDDKYTEATEFTVKAALNVIAEEYDIQIQDLEKMTVADEEEHSIWYYIIIIILAILIAYLKAKYGISSGGYYGGSSGRSSGGGFGGGISGGGGASR